MQQAQKIRLSGLFSEQSSSHFGNVGSQDKTKGVPGTCVKFICEDWSIFFEDVTETIKKVRMTSGRAGG